MQLITAGAIVDSFTPSSYNDSPTEAICHQRLSQTTHIPTYPRLDFLICRCCKHLLIITILHHFMFVIMRAAASLTWPTPVFPPYRQVQQHARMKVYVRNTPSIPCLTTACRGSKHCRDIKLIYDCHHVCR